MSTKYSRRHYEDIAKVLRELPSRGRAVVIRSFVALFSADNSLFDERRFIKACTPTGD